MPSQLMPFNEHRFDLCMVWFSKTFGKPMTQFEMVKLHIMTDVFHVLNQAKPVIGGSLERWPYGPVVKYGYNRVSRREHRFNEGIEDDLFDISPASETVYEFIAKPTSTVDQEDFSVAEVQAMEEAWHLVMDMSFDTAQEFFHDPSVSFMGKAWSAAETNGAPIDWQEIITAYDGENGSDHAHILTIINAGL